MSQLVIPKHHGAKLTDIPDEHLTEVLVRPSCTHGSGGTKEEGGGLLSYGEGRLIRIGCMLMHQL